MAHEIEVALSYKIERFDMRGPRDTRFDALMAEGVKNISRYTQYITKTGETKELYCVSYDRDSEESLPELVDITHLKKSAP